MATIYQKNILSMKNAVKGGFDAFATGIANVTAPLEFPTKTFGHDKAGERRNDTNRLISKVQHTLITENICSNIPEKNNSILPEGHNRGLGGFFFHKGFTLIELLVVVLIIGILAAVALPQYRLAVEKSRSAEAINNISILHRAQQRYYMANGVYSDDINDLDIQIPGVERNGRTETAWFSYAIKNGTNAAETVAANRIPIETEYAFSVQAGNLKCFGYSTLGKRLCRALGTHKISEGSWGELWFISDL